MAEPDRAADGTVSARLIVARLIVDGMNVLGARPDGWWKDRPAAVTRLARRLAQWAAGTGAAVVAVFDGDPPPGAPSDLPEAIEILFAGRGASADDLIARRVAADPDPGGLTVVTSDADLARRVRAAGAGRVVGAGGFRTEIEPNRLRG